MDTPVETQIGELTNLLAGAETYNPIVSSYDLMMQYLAVNTGRAPYPKWRETLSDICQMLAKSDWQPLPQTTP